VTEEINPYSIFINQYCKVVVEMNGQTFMYSAHIIDYNSEKIIFIDKFKNPYSYSTKLVTEVKLQEPSRGPQNE
jgi:hypothetical protein